jgi:hypothetical protein
MAALLRRSTITIVAVLVLSLLAVGLVEAGIAIGTNAARTPAPLGAASVATSDAADGAVADEIDALLAADQTTTATPAAAGRVNKAVAGLRRLAAARKLVHATVVVDLPKLGGLTTIQLDHGTITAVSATSLSVSETGGTTATVKLGNETRVRKNAAKGAVADLKTGDEVFVMSKVESDATEAYLVVVPKT